MVFIALYLQLHVQRSETTPMVYRYPYPPSSVNLVLFNPVVRQHSLSTMDILFSPSAWTFVKPDPFVASVKLTTSLAAVFNTLPPASADLNVYSFGEGRREIVLAYSCSFAPRQNNDQRGFSHSSPASFNLINDNFFFHQPCFNRLHAFADSFLTGMCLHDYFPLVFYQHQFYALPASVATILQKSTTILPRHARPLPIHCS